MNDFSYYNPVQVHFGRNALEALPEELSKYGKNVLLVYGGGSIRRSGVYERILSSLLGAGKEVFELHGVMANPRTEKVYEGIALCRAHHIDFILAVGGGSVMDCSKAVALGAKTDRDFWQAFYKDMEPAYDALPIGTVVTLPATGSELNCSAVISRWDTSEKSCYDSDLIFPRFSILDPTLTYTLPKDQMVNGIVDTISHVMELYFSAPDTPCLTDRISEAVLLTEIESARAALRDPQDYDARANLMWCSAVALCGMLKNGKNQDWASHNIEHALSALYDIAHGAGLAVVHPSYLEYIYRSAPERFAQFARRIFGVDPAGKSTEEVAAEGIRCVRAFFRELGAPATLAELGIPAADIERIAAATDLSCWSYQRLERADVEAILRLAQ